MVNNSVDKKENPLQCKKKLTCEKNYSNTDSLNVRRLASSRNDRNNNNQRSFAYFSSSKGQGSQGRDKRDIQRTGRTNVNNIKSTGRECVM